MAELKRFYFRKLLTLSTFGKIINPTEKSSHSKIVTVKIWRQFSMLTVSWCTIYQVKACLEFRHKEQQLSLALIKSHMALALPQQHNNLHTIERHNSAYIDFVYRASP